MTRRQPRVLRKTTFFAFFLSVKPLVQKKCKTQCQPSDGWAQIARNGGQDAQAENSARVKGGLYLDRRITGLNGQDLSMGEEGPKGVGTIQFNMDH